MPLPGIRTEPGRQTVRKPQPGGGKAEKWLKNSGIDIIIPRQAEKHGPALSVQDPAAHPRQSGRAEIRSACSALGLSHFNWRTEP